ncbi:hypothetical protein DER44DRAFT_851627 [Fusarium oxysporum]|nr:hypothetical protein DER44DRAFT_851627 [Fusarium oxysporum]
MNSTYRRLEDCTKDESFVISQLCNKTLVVTVFGDFLGTFNAYKVAAYGYSFGGLTAAVISIGLHLDGPMYGSVVEEGLKGTLFLLVGTNVTSDPVPGWNAFCNKIDAAKIEMVVNKTRHYALMLSGRKVEKSTNDIVVVFLDLTFKRDAKKFKSIGKKGSVQVLQSDLK